MGQRTMFYTVAEDRDGKVKISGYYNQWGIGRVMPMAVTSCIMNNERRDYGVGVLEGTAFDFKAQRFIQEFAEVYEPEQRAFLRVWNNPRMIGQFTEGFDNNNGAVVLYAKDEPDGESTEYRIGFLLGSEDAYIKEGDLEYNEGNKELGEAFSRWLSLNEWANLECNKEYLSGKFLDWWRPFLSYYEVKSCKD